MIRTRVLASACMVALLSGCASFKAPTYSPDYTVVDSLKTKSLKELSLGEFSPMDPMASVNKISLRAASFKAEQGTFTEYFRDALESDLIEIGVYNESSSTKISATLVENDLDISGFSKGYGIMKVQLVIKQGDVQVLDKVYETTTQFESSFAAAVAVPKAQSEYPVLVKSLLAKIYTDQAFIKAVTKL